MTPSSLYCYRVEPVEQLDQGLHVVLDLEREATLHGATLVEELVELPTHNHPQVPHGVPTLCSEVGDCLLDNAEDVFHPATHQREDLRSAHRGANPSITAVQVAVQLTHETAIVVLAVGIPEGQGAIPNN